MFHALFALVGIAGGLILWGRLNRSTGARIFVGSTIGWMLPDLLRGTDATLVPHGLMLLALVFVGCIVFMRPDAPRPRKDQS